MTVRRKLAIILVALLIFSAGAAGGIILQKFQIPSRILLKCLYTYQTYIKNEASGEPQTQVINLETRKFAPSLKEGIYDTEMDSDYTYRQRLLDLNKTALIIVDPWAYRPNDGMQKRVQENMRSKLLPLLGLARDHNMTIVYAPNRREIAEIVKPLQDEYIVDSNNEMDDTIELDECLKARNITTLLYAGYASNWCVLNRPTGILKMSQLGYDIILVRDCTLAFEMPETLDSEAANLVIINLVENQWGETTTLEDLKAAFQ